ncbi:IS3 family transposase [Carnobacterium maltaromaticum]
MGYRHIDLELWSEGILVNQKKIKRIMKELGLKCVK